MALLGPRFIGDTPAHAALEALGVALQQRHRGDVQCVLFDGSCLRSGELFDGLVDLWVVVRDYRSAHPSWLGALANGALPPNVYYLQLPVHGRTVRCKYAVCTAVMSHRIWSPSTTATSSPSGWTSTWTGRPTAWWWSGSRPRCCRRTTRARASGAR